MIGLRRYQFFGGSLSLLFLTPLTYHSCHCTYNTFSFVKYSFFGFINQIFRASFNTLLKQFSKMEGKKRRRKTFLQKELNAILYAQTLHLRMTWEIPISFHGSQSMKLVCILCMSTHCHLLPSIWQGTQVSSLSLYWRHANIFHL